MSHRSLQPLLHHLFRTARRPDGADSSLLTAFATGRDEPAFAALLGRNGPRSWSLCPRLRGGSRARLAERVAVAADGQSRRIAARPARAPRRDAGGAGAGRGVSG